MGLLDFDGEPLSWSETNKYADHVREHGINQFLHIYENNKDRKGDIFKWGDEMEYMLVKFDHENRKVRLLLRVDEIYDKLREKEEQDPDNCDSLWRKELCNYMIEGIPGKPYEESRSHWTMVEANMGLRRKEIQNHLRENERILSLTAFPRIGCPRFTAPEYDIDGPQSNPMTRSIFIPDEAISNHPRHFLHIRNIRERRGKNLITNIPIFKDLNTQSPFVETFNNEEAETLSKPGHVYLDSMAFGFGCCCLQITLQASNIDEARSLYDELGAISPFMLAISAGSPIFRGYLTDVDTRWNVITETSDDRTDEEKGIKPLENDRFVIRKPRHGSIESYLSVGSNEYSDVKLELDEKAKLRLQNAGIDETLANHIAHLWIRDPLALSYKKLLCDDDENSNYHFESIQSSVWNTVRFKPPPPQSSIGWRVEFRVCDVQLTDFENAAFAVFVVLLTRVLLFYDLTFLMPITMVEENLNEANKRDAARKSKFWFKRQNSSCENFIGRNINQQNRKREIFEQMSLDTIFNGQEGVFPGFIPLIKHYLESKEIRAGNRNRVFDYLSLISKKASGECLTTAQWIREFICSHPEYRKDSMVNDSMTYDILLKCDEISNGEIKSSCLLGKPQYVDMQNK